MVFSNREGEFLVRFPKRKKVNFKVSLDDFLTATPYTIIDAPTNAETALEEQAIPLTVVLQRTSDISRVRLPQ
jgi:hypothetical protein